MSVEVTAYVHKSVLLSALVRNFYFKVADDNCGVPQLVRVLGMSAGGILSPQGRYWDHPL